MLGGREDMLRRERFRYCSSDAAWLYPPVRTRAAGVYGTHELSPSKRVRDVRQTTQIARYLPELVQRTRYREKRLKSVQDDIVR